MSVISKDCSGFCPECGSDIAYENLECHCKNDECSWTCSDCKYTNDKNSN